MENKLPKIFSFSGRKHSGKTELAKVCIKYNYELINFADSLKELICNSLDITREYLEEYKDIIVENKYDLSKKIKYISNEINIEEGIVSEFLSKPFDSIRKILQIIGTNLIRNYNHLWHINKIKDKILNNPDKYFCIGDTRFIDEKQMVEELNGECWFIIRPNMFDISNHYSEINLKWNDFGDDIIINNINKETLIEKWQNYLESLKFDKLSRKVLNTSSKKELRTILINLLKDSSPTSTHLNCSKDKIVRWCNNLMIQINGGEIRDEGAVKEKYKYDINTFLEATTESSYVMGLLTADGCVKQNNNYNCSLNLDNTDKYIVEMYKKVLKSDRPICIRTKLIDKKQVYSFECDNPFIIENIKLWNLKPRKSMNEDIPFLLKNNIEMLKYWIIGLIDGDGSIVLSNRTLSISILGSKQIIEYLFNMLTYGKMNQRKNYDNLYELNFYNHNCIDLREWLGEAVNLGLKHKWNKINEFMLTYS
jgi:hypothetical protein